MGREKCRNDILVFGEIWGKSLYIAKNNHISNTVKMLKNSKKRAKLRQKPLKMPVFSLVQRLTAKTNIIIYKVNRRELYCAVELPLSDYKLYGKQLAVR